MNMELQNANTVDLSGIFFYFGLDSQTSDNLNIKPGWAVK